MGLTKNTERSCTKLGYFQDISKKGWEIILFYLFDHIIPVYVAQYLLVVQQLSQSLHACRNILKEIQIQVRIRSDMYRKKTYYIPILYLFIHISSDVDPVGLDLGPWIRIPRYKKKGKVEFNHRK